MPPQTEFIRREKSNALFTLLVY